MRRAAVLLALLAALAGCSTSPPPNPGGGEVGSAPPVNADQPTIEPVALRIPSIKLDSTKVSRDSAGKPKRFQPLGLVDKKHATAAEPEGSMQTTSVKDPTRFGYYCPDGLPKCGWFYPGQPGTAVITSHVNGNGHKGGFYDLATVSGATDKPQFRVNIGDPVEVDLADGTTQTFKVSRLLTPDKADFPTDLVFSTKPYAQLALVTCGGVLDTKAHSYKQNVIVLADWVDSHATAVG